MRTKERHSQSVQWGLRHAVAGTHAAALVLMTLAAQADPFPLPSSWDFGSDPGKTNLVDFATAAGRAGASWNLQPDTARYTGASSSSSGVASTRFNGLSTGAGFVVEAVASPSFSYWDTLELLALGSAAPTVGTTSTITFNGVSGRFSNNNGSRLLHILDRATGTTLASASWTLGTSGAFSFVLKGEFVDSDLKLTLTATNNSSVSQTITHTIANHAYTSSHDWAGFGGYIAGASRSIAFDSYAVSPVVLPPQGTVITLH